MAIVDEYLCSECGLELSDGGRLFYYNEKSQECIDYLLLMTTASWAEGSRIKGEVNENYCRDCGRFLRIYTIREVDGIENPRKTVELGITNHIIRYKDELKNFEEIKKRENYIIEEDEDDYYIYFPEFEDFDYCGYDESRTEAVENAKREFHIEIDEKIEKLKNKIDAIYLVIDQSDLPGDYHDKSEKVICPECGRELNKFLIPGMPCPKCGNRDFMCFTVCHD